VEFEWDDDKARKNKQKHGISFETAQMVFCDPYRVEFFDDKNSTIEEQRYDVIGKVDDMLFVVYTERTDKIRIISARLATSVERRVYNAYNFNIST
jgi:hypothetical protein